MSFTKDKQHHKWHHSHSNRKTQPILMTPLHSFPTAAAARLHWHLTANTLPGALTRFLTADIETKKSLVDEYCSGAFVGGERGDTFKSQRERRRKPRCSSFCNKKT